MKKNHSIWEARFSQLSKSNSKDKISSKLGHKDLTLVELQKIIMKTKVNQHISDKRVFQPYLLDNGMRILFINDEISSKTIISLG